MRIHDTYVKSQKPSHNDEIDVDMQFSETFTDVKIISPKTQSVENDKRVYSNNGILVIENDEISALIITELLNRKSIPFTFATNVEDGIKEIEKQTFKTIFLGINDPINMDFNLFKTNDVTTKIINTFWIGLTTQFTQKVISNDQKEMFQLLLIKPYDLNEIEKLFFKFQNSTSDINPIEQIPAKNDPMFSLEQLKQVSNNNPEFISKMLSKFLITALECEEIMTSPIDDDLYFERIQKISHKSIPSYSIMGLNPLVNLLENIETNALSSEKGKSLREIIQLFVAGNKVLIADIKDFLNQN